MKRKNQSLIHTLPVINQKFFIYGLIDPRNNQLKYVGLSTIGSKRFYYHFNSCYGKKLTKVKSWIQSLRSHNEIFDVVILEYFEQDSIELDEAEQFWISYFKFLGEDLLNHDCGGRRNYGNYGNYDIEETKIRQSKNLKAALNNPETKALLSDLTKKQWADPEMRAKMSKKVNINKEAQAKSKASARKVRGVKFYDDLGNYYESATEFAEKWNCHVSGVWRALVGKATQGNKYVGRTLYRVSEYKEEATPVLKEIK